jgi:regulation of enolase protein 1 (concanavalin A-like superfamily)
VQPVAATAPAWLRLRRVGNHWLVDDSADGVGWRRRAAFDAVLAVTAAGVSAGNFSGREYQAKFDWFRVHDTANGGGGNRGSVPASTLASDEFDSGLDPGVWAFFTPHASGSANAMGTALEIEAPTGIDHDVRLGGAFAPRVMRQLTDVDFDVEVKFDTRVTLAGQRQGISIEQGFREFVRVALESDGVVTFLDVASVTSDRLTRYARLPVASGAPIHLRVRRVGDAFTVLVSSDGASWTVGASFRLRLAPRAIGLFAGSSVAAAHAASIDWFRVHDPAVGVSGTPASTLASDEFASTPLDPAVWAFVDPLGDGSVVATGARVEISAPAGNAHRFGATVDVPRIMRSAPDRDFEVEAKFESIPTTDFQSQGILVQQDHARSVRAELRATASGASLFVASRDGGTDTVFADFALPLTAPVWLAVRRNADYWRVRYSADGLVWSTMTAFSHVLYVTEIGLYAGNSAGVGFTAAADWFRVNDPTIGVSTAPQSALTTDEFDARTLDPNVWTFVDPLGDGRLVISGTHVEITAPAGRAHDAWSNHNNLPRLVRSAPSTDFTVDVKIDSALAGGTTSQGILIEQDRRNFLQFEYQASGSQFFVVVSGVRDRMPELHLRLPLGSEPTAPMYLRVAKQGPNWFLSRSLDGTVWSVLRVVNQPFTGARIGVYASNRAGTAQTARFDWFRVN